MKKRPSFKSASDALPSTPAGDWRIHRLTLFLGAGMAEVTKDPMIEVLWSLPREVGITSAMTSSLDSPRPPTSVYLGPLVPPVERHLCAPIAQQAERLHGKEKVCGSIPHGGSDSASGATAHRRNMRSIQTVARPGNW